MKYAIYTPYGNKYIIDDDNNIIRTDIKDFKPSNKWKLVGVASTHPFCNHYEPHFATLDSIADGSEEALYKNGNPRYTMVDVDHGTIRVHGNSKVHGISRVEKL